MKHWEFNNDKAEGPGVARGKNKFLRKKNFEFFLAQPQPQKMLAQSVQPFGQLYAAYIYICLVLLYR